VGQRVPGPATSINSQKAFQQQQQGNQLPPQAPVVPTGKLAIGDAFALVTIRLGRIESIIQKLEAEGVIGPNAQQNTGVMEHDDNMRLVDDTVIRNIITRLGDLEKNQTKLTASGKNEPSVDLTPIMQQVNDLQNHVGVLKNELRETKELLMKLQSFSMETNQKMISVILTQEKQESLLKQASNQDSGAVNDDLSLEQELEPESESVSALVSEPESELEPEPKPEADPEPEPEPEPPVKPQPEVKEDFKISYSTKPSKKNGR
jgi:hypothetical protein